MSLEARRADTLSGDHELVRTFGAHLPPRFLVHALTDPGFECQPFGPAYRRILARPCEAVPNVCSVGQLNPQHGLTNEEVADHFFNS